MKAAIIFLTLGFLTSTLLTGKVSYSGLYFGRSSLGWDVVFWVNSNNQIQYIGYDFTNGEFEKIDQAIINDDGTFDFIAFGDRYVGTVGEESFQGEIVGYDITFSGDREPDYGPYKSFYGGYQGSVASVGNSIDFFQVFLMGISAEGKFYCYFDIDEEIAGGGIGQLTSESTFTFLEPGGSEMSGFLEQVHGPTFLRGYFDHPVIGEVYFSAANLLAANHLVNVSTRGYVGSGEDVMIAGFIVWSGGKTVLIRGVGPSLSDFGVENALQNPEIRLMEGQTAIGYNDDWQTNTNTAAITSTTIPPKYPREAALYVRLEPGYYSVIMSGVGGASGVGLIEVYEVY